MVRLGKGFITLKSELPSAYELAKAKGVDKEGDVQHEFTNLVLKNIVDFMPKRLGGLISKMRKVNAWRIRNDSDYANYMFFGKRKGGGALHYSRVFNANAGPNFDRRMFAARGEKITADLQRYLNTRGGVKK